MFKKSSARGGHSIDTLIGPQVVIRGEVAFTGGLYVEGRIQGNVVAQDGPGSVLTLAEHGVIEGEVRVPVVVLNGTLSGDVHAGERIELGPRAQVQGNVHYKVVEMNAGAVLTGRLIHQEQAPVTAALPSPEAMEAAAAATA